MSIATLECPVCGATGSRTVPGPQRRWRYVACVGCGHERLVPAPTPEALAEYYNGAYAVPLARYADRASREYPALRQLLAENGVRTGRLLEVGCSYGEMLTRFASDGWTVEGVELDRRAASYAREHHHLAIHDGTLAEAEPHLRGAPYDVVAMYHVIEHVLEPVDLLRRLAGVLRPGGLLLLKTPNVESLAASATAGWWEWRAAPEHVHLYSPRSLRTLLERVGFAVVHVSSRTGDAHADAFEILRASAKRVLRGTADTASPARLGVGLPVSQRPWFMAGERLSRLASVPISSAVAALSSGDRQLGPELVVVAALRDRQTATS